MQPLVSSAASLVLALTLAPAPLFAAEPGAEVRRLQQQRDQQQTELRLRMQQQQERAPAAARAPEFRQHQLELNQQQRQRELHERQSRALAVAPPPPGAPVDAAEAARRQIEDQRAQQERIELMQRLQWERRERQDRR
jgi:hypothetical protein